MRWLFLIVGGAATVAMLCISMRLNFLFGYSLGQTSEKAWVFGWVSVISDAWKALGPIFILALYRDRRRWSTAGASAIWIACFLYSVSSALGVAIEDRSSRTGSREAIVTNYVETTAELERLEKRRAALSASFWHSAAPHRNRRRTQDRAASRKAAPPSAAPAAAWPRWQPKAHQAACARRQASASAERCVRSGIPSPRRGSLCVPLSATASVPGKSP